MGKSGLSASRNIKAGMGDILCSELLSCLMQAPFNLSKQNLDWLQLEDGLKAPAEAAGLTDRGEIIEGKRADLILIRQLDFGERKLKATFVNGSPVYRSAWL